MRWPTIRAPGTYPFARLPGFWKASALSSPSFRLESVSLVKNSREVLEPMPQPWWELWTPTKLRWSLRVARAGAGLCWKKPNPASPDTVAVLRLQFAADAKGEVDALLVLQPTAAPEVARARPAVE